MAPNPPRARGRLATVWRHRLRVLTLGCTLAWTTVAPHVMRSMLESTGAPLLLQPAAVIAVAAACAPLLLFTLLFLYAALAQLLAILVEPGITLSDLWEGAVTGGLPSWPRGHGTPACRRRSPR